MAKIKCYYNHIIYPRGNIKSKNGFTIVLYNFISGDDDKGRIKRNTPFIGVGNYLTGLSNAEYELEGDWQTNKKTGDRQFCIKSCSENLHKSKNCIIEFFSQCTLQANAKKIYRTFGDNTFDKLDQNINLIKEVGLSDMTTNKIKRFYINKRSGTRLLSELYEYDVDTSLVYQIIEDGYSYNDISSDPYILYKKYGMNFAECDKYAKTKGLKKDCKQRINALIIMALANAEMSGDCGITYTTALSQIKKLCKLTEKQFQEAILDNINDKEICCYENLLFRQKTFDDETNIAKRILELNQASNYQIVDIDKRLDEWESLKAKELGIKEFKLDPLQRQAIINSLNSGFSVITGGAGCGKTTIDEAIIWLWQNYGQNKSVCGVCPTGKAAQRMKEATKLVASTIHSRLEIFDSENYQGTERIIDEGLLICDEMSMVDVHVASDLLTHIKNGTKVIFQGDINQLPSVACGAVLRDIIESGQVTVTKLNKTFRQSDKSSIIKIANNIIAGNNIFQLFNNKDSAYVHAKNLHRATSESLALYVEKVKEYGIENVCMLTPLHHHLKNAVGYCPSSDELNIYAQARLNPPSKNKKEVTISVRRRIGFDYGKNPSLEPIEFKLAYRVDDVIMVTKNGDGFTNGDIGVIKDVVEDNEGKKALKVSFPEGEKIIYQKNFKDIELAYAMSIHKSQGSEYKCVILVLPIEAKIMLQRNLFYTGVTRAKNQVIIISSKEAINLAISQNATLSRKTFLKEKLILAFKDLAKAS